MNKNVNISKTYIKTERLILRPFNESDLSDFYEYAKEPGTGEAAGWAHHESIERSKDVLSYYIFDARELAVTLNDKVIGSIGINKYNEKIYPELDNLTGVEIGFVLSKKYWGNGYMSEAVKEIISYSFDTLHADFIICCRFTGNERCRRITEKFGFIPIKKIVFRRKDESLVNAISSILYNKNVKHVNFHN